MASYSLESPFTGVHGKLCGHSTIQFHVRNATGTTYTSRTCRKRTSPLSADELTQRALFKAASDYAKAQMLNPTKRQAAELRYKAAKENKTFYAKYHSLRTYLMGESFNGDQVN